MQKFKNMGYNKFYGNIVVRILFIIATAYILAFISSQDDKIVSSIIINLLILIQGALMLRFIKKENQHLDNAIKHLEYQDVSVNINHEFLNMHDSEVISKIRNVKADIEDLRVKNEIQREFISTLVDQINIGILVYNSMHEVLYANQIFKNEIAIQQVKNIADIENANTDLAQRILALKTGKSSIVEIKDKEKSKAISLQKSKMIVLNESFDIVLVNNIKNEIAQIQIESWQKLIRVLNHEIMNSITPIISLSETNNKLFYKYSNESDLDLILQDIKTNNEVIQERSKNLNKFIDNYRKLSQIPKPERKLQNLSSSIKNVIKLFDDEMEKEKIQFQYINEIEDVEIEFDKVLIEQVFINLIRNAIQSFEKEDSKNIQIRVINENSKIQIEISDNGKGIKPVDLKKIFIPFFTTKKSGSGIGLSVCQQIMYLHEGEIEVESVIGEGTKFTLKF
jgi:nitrogen fixation/metabolism regulation signal transduction histidine kinase